MSNEARHHGHHPEHHHHQHHGHHHEVEVRLNCSEKKILAGDYLVMDLKARLGVPPDYQLEEIVCGEFKPLADDALIHIKGGEDFVSHVCRGGSS